MHFSSILPLLLFISDISSVIIRPITCPAQVNPAPIGSEVPSIVRQSIKRVKRLLYYSVTQTSARGIMAGISYRGETLWTAGIGSIEAGSPQRPDRGTLFKISSVSQIYTSLILFALIEEGKIKSLDDPLIKYCPLYNITNPYSRTQLTFRHILTHMSGLPKWGTCSLPVDYVTDNYCDKKTSHMIDGIKSEHWIGPAFHKPHLSNLAFSILGHFLMDITNHTSYTSLLQDIILTPLGVCKTGTDVTTETRPRATGYKWDHREVLFNVTTGWYAPAGEVYSCVNDLILLTELFYQAHRFGDQTPTNFISPSWRLQMGLPSYIAPDGKTMLGMPFHLKMVAGYLVRFYIGSMPGYQCVFSFVTELQVGFVSLWNGAVSTDLEVLTEKIYKELIPVLRTHSLATEYIHKQDENRIQRLMRYTGEYQIDNTTVLRARMLGVNLVGTGLGYEQVELEEVGDNELQVAVGESDGRSCYERNSRGVDGEKILFYDSETGGIAGFRMPGLFGAEIKIKRRITEI